MQDACFILPLNFHLLAVIFLYSASVLLNSNTKSEKLHMTQFNVNKRRNVLYVINSR